MSEALAVSKSEQKPIDLEAMQTSDISSDEVDVFERKKNFDEI